MKLKAPQRDSFLSLRLDERLKTRIWNVATRRFQKPSDYARQLLAVGVERDEKRGAKSA
jgi:predicted transcriptional regulator